MKALQEQKKKKKKNLPTNQQKQDERAYQANVLMPVATVAKK